MHSNWQICDFFSSYKKDFLIEYEGILALNTFDPLCLKMVKDFLMRGAGERIVHYKMGDEVTAGWVEEEFQALSLFGNTESFFIHEAQDLKSDLAEKIFALDLTGRCLILSFESENASWKKLLKNIKITSITIDEPRFRDFHKLLDFVCAYLRLPLSYEAKLWMLDSIENDLPSFYNSCCLLKLNFPDAREVSIADVKGLLTLEKLDQFALATLLGRKKGQQFFEKIIQLDADFERMRGLFTFMQGHLIKMLDPSYLTKKSYTTQYDKEIQSVSKLWKKEELEREVERFNRWELMCKKKDFLLWHELREASLH